MQRSFKTSPLRDEVGYSRQILIDGDLFNTVPHDATEAGLLVFRAPTRFTSSTA